MRAVIVHSTSGEPYAQVEGSGWRVAVWDPCLFLDVDPVSASVRLTESDGDRLVRAWDSMRDVYGGPTAAEVRDAIRACREVLRGEAAE